ncbi:hypothetical protein D3C71_1404330 [compost metagenome]
MRFQTCCRLVADSAWSRQDAARSRAVLKEGRTITLHLEGLARGLRSGVERRHTDQGVEQAIHPVVDDLGCRYGYAFSNFVQLVAVALVEDFAVRRY